MYGCQFKAFVEWMRKNREGVVYLKDVTNSIAEEFASHLKTSGVSNNTFSKYVKLLHLAFHILGKAEGLTSNPFSEIKKLKVNQQHWREMPIQKVFEIIRAAKGAT